MLLQLVHLQQEESGSRFQELAEDIGLKVAWRKEREHRVAGGCGGDRPEVPRPEGGAGADPQARRGRGGEET